MAVIKVKYNCGCGYSTEKAEEAIQHSDVHNHTMTVLGTIQKDNSIYQIIPKEELSHVKEEE